MHYIPVVYATDVVAPNKKHLITDVEKRVRRAKRHHMRSCSYGNIFLVIADRSHLFVSAHSPHMPLCFCYDSYATYCIKKNPPLKAGRYIVYENYITFRLRACRYNNDSHYNSCGSNDII
jgi:hypothetical protein